MKVKISFTLSRELLAAIDEHAGGYRYRSEFIQAALNIYLAQLARAEAERRDIEIINRRADALNAEAEDVLAYQRAVRSSARRMN